MNSQYSPERERYLRRDSPTPSPRPTTILPRYLELMRPNGIFYPIEAGGTPIAIPNGFVIGMRDPNGVLRPLFNERVIVRVKRIRRDVYDIVPLTLQEYRHYGFNSDITTNTDPFIRYVGEIRRTN